MLQDLTEHLIKVTGKGFIPNAYQDPLIGVAILLFKLANCKHKDLLGYIKKDTEAIREGSFNTGIRYLDDIRTTALSKAQIVKYFEKSEDCFREALGVYENVLFRHPIIEFYIGFSIIGQGRKDGFSYLRKSLKHSFQHLQYAMYYTSIEWNRYRGHSHNARRYRNLRRFSAALMSYV